MKQETIVVSHLKKSYGQKIVTNDISITFYSGQIVAIIGHNGAGKSTFLNQINGTVASDEGIIHIEGVDVTNHPGRARELVSSMPQFQVPIKGVTVEEAIECIGAVKGMNSSLIESRTKELIDFLEISKWKHTPGEKLSGGLQRLTSFAMSVVDSPSIVVLDEPTNDVDPFRRSLIWRYLRSLANSGATVIIVSHNLFEVERYADRYLLFDKGRIKRDVLVSETKNARQLKHQVSLSGANEEVISNFMNHDNLKYDNVEKRLMFTVEDGYLTEVISVIFDLLKTDKIISYEIKLKNLSDDYEEYINEY
ncbi:ABC transporter ATP-binding protein [Streptococcus agalactiae]|uniref:ABC transporter ATP-binding protein n=1 Tax=Streptococcus agalactiae TaxID=1311 RepID=UPI0002BB4408|nr:ABC transporter ATP-binding protein [Streptococcus agalactiae]AOQ20028.1 ABC transporter ATP-binding protein [Streptococcus agalactiae]EPU08780.1 ABC transporter ATP-binding protein [Streptococcus agalactiae STIR-CD-21]EPU12819.1 ABC transporter ATP-binding protein [Streptococcus agalactiae STIR-CD-22]MCD0026923.1 ABC transporter ATP-binding protein [Streptococcus agalactiae]OZV77580.1 ABC transporter ATP-binding protein [Streptococcus agalactiae]